MNAFERMYGHLARDEKLEQLTSDLADRVLAVIYGYDQDLDLDIARLAREAAVRYVRDVFKEALA